MKKEFEKRLYSSLIIIPISLFFLFQGSVFFIFFLSTILIVTSYEWIKMLKKNFLTQILGILFLIISFYSAYKFRTNVGLHPFILIILICIFTDIGGYVFGKIFKGPKLTKISPNKTYSGLLGSFIFPVIVSLIYNKYYTLTGTYFSSKLPGVNFELNFLFFILFISMISQLGDLIISFFKREAKVKDTGNLLPGHGGLLDRIDGLIFVIPILYLTL